MLEKLEGGERKLNIWRHEGMTMRGFPVGLALPSARADTGGICGAQLGKMGISGAHAPVGTAGSSVTVHLH